MLDDVLMYVAGALMLFGIFGIAITVAMFLLAGFGLKRIAERDELPNVWMAFVPPLNLYILGQVAKEKSQLPWKEHLPILYPSLLVGSVVLSPVPILGAILPIAFFVISSYILFLVFERFSDHPVLFLVLTVVTGGFLYPILIFSCRNNVPLNKAKVLEYIESREKNKE